MNKKRKDRLYLILFGVFLVFIVSSRLVDFEPGEKIGLNLWIFVKDMLVVFPAAFILVGLFNVWVDRSIIEKHFGESSGAKGYIGAILLSATTIAPFVVVIPMAAALYKKGARLSIVMTYLSASMICRIPMTLFEASFLGVKFTLIRYIVSLPLVLISSILIEKIMKKSVVLENV
jgi:uncharacterized membrane protein YraQ (UPF0718 family)